MDRNGHTPLGLVVSAHQTDDCDRDIVNQMTTILKSAVAKVRETGESVMEEGEEEGGGLREGGGEGGRGEEDKENVAMEVETLAAITTQQDKEPGKKTKVRDWGRGREGGREGGRGSARKRERERMRERITVSRR